MTRKDIAIMMKTIAGVLVALTALTLLTLAGRVVASAAVSQLEADCPGVKDAETFPQLVNRVVKVAENQAFLLTQKYAPGRYPTGGLANGTYETQPAGMN